MAKSQPPESFDFLQDLPAPVVPAPAVPDDPADRLPQDVVDDLMRLAGVDGVWVERDGRGRRAVVLHYTPKGSTAHLPKTVHGLPIKVVGGEPIRAQPQR